MCCLNRLSSKRGCRQAFTGLELGGTTCRASKCKYPAPPILKDAGLVFVPAQLLWRAAGPFARIDIAFPGLEHSLPVFEPVLPLPLVD
eukprot:scaffold5674_cov129-Isochrysis_galbana.AAC.5